MSAAFRKICKCEAFGSHPSALRAPPLKGEAFLLLMQICISIFHKSNPLYLCIPMKFSGKNRIFVENWYRLRYTETGEFGIVSKMSPLILLVIIRKEVPI